MTSIKSLRIFAKNLKTNKKRIFTKNNIFINKQKENTMRTLTNIFDFAFFAAEEDYFLGRSNTVIS